jgi:uncharacterized repeat protein (TIGR03803 family)
MTKLSAWRMAGVMFLLFAATAIAASGQIFNTLYNFGGDSGEYPLSTVAQGRDGNFYGTTEYGGTGSGCRPLGCGTIFKITPDGTLTTLYSFCALTYCTSLFGEEPSGLVLATDGNFYGTTAAGGPSNFGTFFRITPTGTLTNLHSFDGTDGSRPLGTLVQATDGSFYGTTQSGGDLTCDDPYGCGTVFKITPTGALTTLHSFEATDGYEPGGGVVQANDGNFYGTTPLGGAHNAGTVFRITLKGRLTTVHTFDGTDGYFPAAGMVQATDGNLYGTTNSGGTYGVGVVFRISLGGALTTLYGFCAQGSPCTDGSYPAGPLVQATDGDFYGTTDMGGSGSTCEYACGTIFKITRGGALTTLHTFDDAYDSAYPTGLIQASDGSFFGTTSYSGSNNDGTVFELNVGIGPFVTLVHDSGRVGHSGGILGQGFTGTTSVSLNGVPASFTVISDTFLKATVPVGATTGYVTVTTPGGTLTSNVPFRVIQ